MMQFSVKAVLLVCVLVVSVPHGTNAFQSPHLSQTGNSFRTRSVVHNTNTNIPSKNLLTVGGGQQSNKKESTTTNLYSTSKELDVDAIVKYGTAAGVQMSLFAATLFALDQLATIISPSTPLPAPAVGILFYALSLKSRVFNPLNNKRPKRDKLKEGSDGFRDRVMPSWTPPGVVFPIMWVLIIGPARAYSSSLVFQANGHHLFDPTLLSFLLHLTMGDIWNTINNTEKRYGAAVVGILGVVASAAFAATQYYQADPLAGQILGATLLWLTTASALIADTWRLNPNADGQRDPLYPVKGDAQTSFLWFAPATAPE